MSLDPAAIANRRWRRVAELSTHCAEGELVPSPCQSVCVMHAGTGWCDGCLRTIDEIAAWSGMDRARKLEVWTQLPERLARRMAMEQP